MLRLLVRVLYNGTKACLGFHPVILQLMTDPVALSGKYSNELRDGPWGLQVCGNFSLVAYNFFRLIKFVQGA